MIGSSIIRNAVVSEQKALEALQLRASLANAGDRDSLLAQLDAIAIPPEQIADGHVFVLEWQGSIAGFSAVGRRPDSQTELDALFVEPTIRRRGIGRALIEYCVAFARQQGSTALHVIGNPHALDFYTACGFEVIGTTATRFGVGLLMRKLL